MAGAAAAATHPLDTAKTMLAAGAEPPAMLPLMRRLVAERGVGALFVGLGASLASNVPFIGVSWATFTTGSERAPALEAPTAHPRLPWQS